MVHERVNKNASFAQLAHLGRRQNAEGVHDSIREFLSHLGHDQAAHAGACATAYGVSQLESLQETTRKNSVGTVFG